MNFLIHDNLVYKSNILNQELNKHLGLAENQKNDVDLDKDIDFGIFVEWAAK